MNSIDFDLLADLAEECFSPLTYAGGVATEEDVSQLFKIGIEKVCINSSLRSHQGLVERLSAVYGSQSIIASVDLKEFMGGYRIYRHEAAWLKHNIFQDDVLPYLQNLACKGIGEMFINFVNRDGMYTGYDIEMINAITKAVRLPITVCGGANYNDLYHLANNTSVSGVAAGSVFCFRDKSKGVLINYPDLDDIESNVGPAK